MPICQHCQKQWSFGQTFKKSFTLDPAIPCPYCGTKQYVAKKSKQKFIVLPFIPLLGLVLNLFDIHPVIVLSYMLVSAAIIICLSPFLIKLANEEQHLI